MKAVILAAGMGLRLVPITNTKPKTMVKVNGKPIISYIIDGLIKNGVVQIVVCIGYKSEKIIEYCKLNYSDVDLVFVPNKRYTETNNMYSLYLAREYLNEDFFLMNADVVFDEGVFGLLKKENTTSIAVDKGNYIEESMKVVVDEKNTIKAISKKILPQDSYGCSIDVYKINKADIPCLLSEMENIIEKNRDENQWTEVLLDKLFQNGKLVASPCNIGNNRWFEIDNYEDLQTAESLFSDKLKSLSGRKIYFIDRDGTLSIGNKKIEGIDHFINKLKEKNKEFYILTNNSSKSGSEHAAALTQMGIRVDGSNVLLSLDAALHYLGEKRMKEIYFVANEKVSSYIQSRGFIFNEANPHAVLLTYDTEITFQKLSTVSLLIKTGLPYFATHTDIVCPTEWGYVPDIGTFIEVIRLTAGRLPDKTFGKPSKDMVLSTLKNKNFTGKDAVVIGDRLYTDIKLAEGSDMASVLVLSGETKREDYEDSDVSADIVVKSVEDLIPYI